MMRVLIVTGDRNFKAGNPRYDLMATVADITAVYWGRGALKVRLQEMAYDVVTVQDPFWRGLVAWRLARRFRARFNVQVHADLAAQSWLKRLVARFVLRKADSVRVVSEKLKAQVLKYALKARITVLPIFIDVEKFKKIERKPHEGKIILWIGRFEDEKNPEAALSIFKSVRDAGIDASLVMLGVGKLGKRLKAAYGMKRADLPDVFPGWVDPSEYLARADVVVCTSWNESFGAVIVEALASGVPVVSPDVGIAREAGATVVPRAELATAVIAKLREGARGILTMDLPDREHWGAAWLATLA